MLPRLLGPIGRWTRILPFVAAPLAAQAPALSAPEQRLRDWIRTHRDEEIALLAQAVNIPSGTMNFQGVRRTADLFRPVLDQLGFVTRWVPMDAVRRAGHLVAEHRGKPGSPVILLIGHLDTVFEGLGQEWQRVGTDSMARGAGASDMKGGDVVMLYALKALAEAGALADANVLVIFTGDEERPGQPLAVARRDLIDLGKRADVALAFESGTRGSAVAARRGSSAWRLEVTGRQAHSSGIFGDSAGYGAIYEAARIVNAFRRQLSGVPNLTFNPGIIAGGTDVALDSGGVNATVSGKLNIVAPKAVVSGDLRFITDNQRDSARAVMRRIVAQSLPGTTATITFEDLYPAMASSEANRRLLAAYSEASQALGYGTVEANDPGRRGAGDISFIAPDVPAELDGLGVAGTGAHSPDERVNLNSLAPQTERAAVLLYRLLREKRLRS